MSKYKYKYKIVRSSEILNSGLIDYSYYSRVPSTLEFKGNGAQLC